VNWIELAYEMFVVIIFYFVIQRSGHMARTGECKRAWSVMVVNIKKNDDLGDLGVDGRILLK
jgi:hypothetical protein